MKNRSSASIYISIVFFVLYLFATQWSISASFANQEVLQQLMAKIAYCSWILSIVMALYKIVSGFAFYVQHRWFLFFSFVAIIFLTFVSKTPSVVLPVMIGFAAIHANNRSIAKTIVISLSLFLVTSYILSLLGLNGGDVVSKPLFGQDDSELTVSNALGLTNPNVAMLLFVNIVLLVLYLCKKRNIYTLASMFLLVMSIILAKMTGSTTGLLISVSSIILMFAYKYVVGFKVIVQKINPYMFILITLLSFMVAVNFGPNRPNAINDTLTNRPYLWDLRIENGSYLNAYGDNDQYKINRELSDDDNQYGRYPLDNEPIYVMVHYGIIAYLLFVIIYYLGSKKLGKYDLQVYVFMVCVAVFVEKIAFLGFVYIFLQKAIADYYVLEGRKKIDKSKKVTA